MRGYAVDVSGCRCIVISRIPRTVRFLVTLFLVTFVISGTASGLPGILNQPKPTDSGPKPTDSNSLKSYLEDKLRALRFVGGQDSDSDSEESFSNSEESFSNLEVPAEWRRYAGHQLLQYSPYRA
jgi:hypothetical protein